MPAFGATWSEFDILGLIFGPGQTGDVTAKINGVPVSETVTYYGGDLSLLNLIGGNSGGTLSWTWNFTKSFFTFAGGPGNKPTCAGQTLRSIGNELTGGFFTGQAAETSLRAASVYQTAGALQYAAGRPNSLGGIGLICPSCSSVFRSMMSKAEFLGEASEAVPLVETSYAAGSSIPEVSAQARSGECSAAFPVF